MLEECCGCYSHYFLVPKKDRGLHLILDLHPLNAFLWKEKFKMLTLAKVLSALDPGDWMVALDLQDAYFHIPVLQAHRHYLRFMVGQEAFPVVLCSPLALPVSLGCSKKSWRTFKHTCGGQGYQSFPTLMTGC